MCKLEAEAGKLPLVAGVVPHTDRVSLPDVSAMRRLLCAAWRRSAPGAAGAAAARLTDKDRNSAKRRALPSCPPHRVVAGEVLGAWDVGGSQAASLRSRSDEGSGGGGGGGLQRRQRRRAQVVAVRRGTA